MLPLQVVAVAADQSHAHDLTDLLDGPPSWTTMVPGGFGSCTFRLLGANWRKRLPYLSTVRITSGSRVLFEGQVTQQHLNISGQNVSTEMTALGPRSRLADARVAKTWVQRELAWRETAIARGTTLGAVTLRKSNWDVVTGAVDPATSIVGVRMVVAVGVQNSGDYNGAEYNSPVDVLTLLCSFNSNVVDSNGLGIVQSSSDGTTYTTHLEPGTATSTISQALAANARYVRLGAYYPAGAAATVGNTVTFSNIRFLGVTTSEDASGGYWGGTLLRSIIGFVPGIAEGNIETGSDYVIQALDSAEGATAEDLVKRVASYYTREWSVWDDGRFYWQTVNFDSPTYIAPVACFDEIDLAGEIDGIGRTVYVRYRLAGADNQDAQTATAAATNRLNPYVLNGQTKDKIYEPPHPLSSADASQLATTLATLYGSYPSARGTVKLPASWVLGGARGGIAYGIRAGENILIPDLPKTDLFANGRDGETLFHVIATSCDGATVTLTLDSQPETADVLLARLSAA